MISSVFAVGRAAQLEVSILELSESEVRLCSEQCPAGGVDFVAFEAEVAEDLPGLFAGGLY